MKQLAIRLGLLLFLMESTVAQAWFVIIPTGAIKRAFETDPETIVVSASDRALGKCAGLHVNQGQKHARWDSPNIDATGGRREAGPQSPEYVFHEKMANVAIDKSSDKDKVKDLADAYSTRWSRVAGADLSANRAYGADLARGCVQNNIALRYADQAAWQARQDELQRIKQDEERRRAADEAQARLRAEEEAKRTSLAKVTAKEPQAAPTQAARPQIDFGAEAKKAARILGCTSDDPRVLGVEGQSIIFSANCQSGPPLLLACDPTGLCLRK